jgi:hypothetical protein
LLELIADGQVGKVGYVVVSCEDIGHLSRRQDFHGHEVLLKGLTRLNCFCSLHFPLAICHILGRFFHTSSNLLLCNSIHLTHIPRHSFLDDLLFTFLVLVSFASWLLMPIGKLRCSFWRWHWRGLYLGGRDAYVG